MKDSNYYTNRLLIYDPEDDKFLCGNPHTNSDPHTNNAFLLWASLEYINSNKEYCDTICYYYPPDVIIESFDDYYVWMIEEDKNFIKGVESRLMLVPALIRTSFDIENVYFEEAFR